MTRGSRRLLKLLKKRDELIFAQMDFIHFCNDRGSDLDTVHMVVNDYKDRLQDENMFLRERLLGEGWYFLDFFLVDPRGIFHSYHWDHEPDPSEYYYFHAEKGIWFNKNDIINSQYINAIKRREDEILNARAAGVSTLQATEKFFDERKKEIEAKKQKEEEIWRAREAAQQMQEQGSNFDKPAFQILKRPQGCEMQSSSSHDMAKLEEKTRTMTLQEREAAYLQARERIFGGVCRFDEDRDLAFDQMVRSAASCVPAGVPLPCPSYHASNPRPRLPTVIRTPRPPLYQQPFPLGVTFPGIPPFRIPPPPPGTTYTPSLPPVSQQRFPITGMHHAPNTQLQRLPYFDSRIPPPAAPPPPPPPYMGQNLAQNLIGMNPAFSDPTRNNPVPYGRPPTQLLSQNQFTLSFSDQSNRFY
ncbi:SUZ domain family protein [Acanthocheilonema viteae]